MSSQDQLPQPATPRDPASSPSVEWTDASRRSAKGGGEHPLSFLRSPFSIGNNLGVYLQNYFRSGWAFFIPYLAAYLLYAWLRWPVNPVTGDTPPATDSVHLSPFSLLLPPSLLHVYWVLHAVHLVLGAFAIRSWLRQTFLHHSPFSLLLKAAPWLCLALLFYIPGIYLEWPSDPWEHLRRINEWRILDEVTAHSAWKKSSYFLPYSLTQHVTGLTQLSWLNFYYTAIALLLAWQYYRMARAVGVSTSIALLVTVSTPLLLGNTSFSFWQYYGLSSSIYGQIAVVAALRWAIEAKWITPKPVSMGLDVGFLSSLVTIFGLLVFAGLSHPQALLSAVLGLVLMLSWRWSKGRPERLVCLVGGLITTSVIVAFALPRNPQWVEVVDSAGWVGPGGGFALLDTRSPAFERALWIIGGFGTLNLVAALYLSRENHPAAWLVLGQLVLLACPVVAIPLINLLIAEHQPILVFHRLLFVIPPTLAVVIVSARLLERLHVRLPAARFCFLIIILLGLSLAPVGSPVFNRVFHLWAHHSELRLVALTEAVDASLRNHQIDEKIIGLPSVSFGLHALMPDFGLNHGREIWGDTPAQNVETMLQQLTSTRQPLRFLILDAVRLTQPKSTMGFVTEHWLPNHSAMHLAGQNELALYAASAGKTLAAFNGTSIYSLAARRPFLAAYNQVIISPGPLGLMSFNPPPGHSRVFELAGAIMRGTANAFGYEPSPLSITEFKPYQFLRSQSSDGVLRLSASPDFALDLKHLQTRETTQSPPSTVGDFTSTPFEVLTNLRIKSHRPPGGLLVQLDLDPASTYRFDLRGAAAGTPASLRIRAAIDGRDRIKYLSLTHTGAQFIVSNLGAIELLIYQDAPFEYLLHSLSITKEDSSSELLNGEVFSPTTH